MSIRLIKQSQPADTSTVVLFSFPESAGARAFIATAAGETAAATNQQAVAEQERMAALEKQKREAAAAAARQNEIAAEAARLTAGMRSRLEETIVDLATLRTAIAARAERELTRLAIEIAKKIVHREISTDREVVTTLVRMALSRLQNRTVARVHLHPEDFAYLNANIERLESKHSVELIDDPSVQRGGCLVETELGDVDARVEQQFAEIERALLGD